MGYLNKQTLAQLNNQFGGYNTRRGPGSVRSLSSNRSGRSNGSTQSMRSRGRGRGRGGVSRKFLNKQVLNPKLQREIAAIQGKTYTGNTTTTETPSGVNFTPTPSSTNTSMNQRFSNM
ncbi:hypothetical protein EVAR_24394_1 [Eumeta japonica]|uniref:Uncharacterized protein n=1 Tax=Eumeta variegata TaxID=151549 RepID=A0A4C1VQS0_EUMVA|nr:hypothetical protein EVAR_24394_1 [Eumeta japonica]